MFDHVSIAVADFDRATRFYDAALATLGVKPLVAHSGMRGYGAERPQFWIGPPAGGKVVVPPHGHICFAAPDRAAVHAFHATCLAQGGRDNGAPGLRAHYHPSYYAAFAFDPDGYQVEAVCHRP
jgi:catechol 2,3-dioxygenase-like lactoylglutathione lyase family enzyme